MFHFLRRPYITRLGLQFTFIHSLTPFINRNKFILTTTTTISWKLFTPTILFSLSSSSIFFNSHLSLFSHQPTLYQTSTSSTAAQTPTSKSPTEPSGTSSPTRIPAPFPSSEKSAPSQKPAHQTPLLCIKPQESSQTRLHISPNRPEWDLHDVSTPPPNYVTPSGARGTYDGLLSQALHTVYRANVGGSPITPTNDTLWRNWVSDDDYLVTPNAAKTSEFHIDIFYQPGGATKYSAPDPAYQTAKELNVNSSGGSNFFNITWRFNVSKNAPHFIRVHFCDIVSTSINDVLQFNLYLYSKFSQNIYPYNVVGQLAVPFYKDFVVDSDNSGFMDISIGPRNDKTAFLNGVEIMEVITGSGLVTEVKKHLSVVVGSVVGSVASLLMSVVVVVVCLNCKRAKPVEPSVWQAIPDYGGGSSYGQLENIVVPLLVGKINPNSLRKFGETVEKCLKEYGVQRPNMNDVVWDLEYALQLQQTARNNAEENRAYFLCWVALLYKFKSGCDCEILLEAALCNSLEQPTTLSSPAEAAARFVVHVLALAGSATSRQHYSWQQTDHHPVPLQSLEVTLSQQPNPSQSTNANSTATIQSCFFNSSLLKWKVMNNRCAKFKSKPLEHVDLMERVYSSAAATGKHAWTPTEMRDDDVTATNANKDNGMGPLSTGTPPQLGHDTVAENVVDSSLFNDALPSQPWMDQPMQNDASGQRLVLSLVTWTISWK
ncbi:putative receptor-like protein kinase [Camellia lanceoleosa]|uniref:Receptor-like protein kinase n=1 Tax=Camellia lanceoleosa TaxID=1840588 RepID=A0ACC0IZI0_9ERIC|nr:putative receptor-like protein kinase [Camellia lanceoleosa]